MRRNALLPVLSLLALLACGQSTTDAAPDAGGAEMSSEDDKTLYALGLSIGKSLEQFRLTPAELEKVEAGLTDAATKAEPKVKLEEYIGKVRELAKSRAQAAAAEQKDKSAKALEELTKTAGATKLESGVIYIETQAGTGASPVATDTVSVHYKGTLTDGTEFDSSYSRGQPAKFPLRGVVPCWTEGIQKMKVGGKAKLGCPSDVAYGDEGRPPAIPGGAALIFEVELLGIETK